MAKKKKKSSGNGVLWGAVMLLGLAVLRLVAPDAFTALANTMGNLAISGLCLYIMFRAFKMILGFR
jgi:hypothetical protein